MRLKIEDNLFTSGEDVKDARIIIRPGVECQYILITACKACDHSQVHLEDKTKLKCLHMDRGGMVLVDKKKIPTDCPLQKTTVTISVDKDNLTTWFKDALSNANCNK